MQIAMSPLKPCSEVAVIYHHGNQKPSAFQKRMLMEYADDSFTSSVPESFGEVPCRPPWRLDRSTGVALRMKCVDPHIDDWIGEGNPKRHAGMFWLVEIAKSQDLFLQVGNAFHRMREGDFVIFNDGVLHSVCCSRIWRGYACQARHFVSRASKGAA